MTISTYYMKSRMPICKEKEISWMNKKFKFMVGNLFLYFNLSVSLPFISSVVIPSRSSPWNKRNRSSNIRNTLFLNCFIIFYFIQFCTHFRLQRFSHSMYRRLSNIDTSIALSSTSSWRVSVAWLTLL